MEDQNKSMMFTFTPVTSGEESNTDELSPCVLSSFSNSVERTCTSRRTLLGSFKTDIIAEEPQSSSLHLTETEVLDEEFPFEEQEQLTTPVQEEASITASTSSSKRKHVPGCQRQTYLVTYSQADAALCSSREHFAEICTTGFGHGNHLQCRVCKNGENCFNCEECNVMEWACCQEKHQDGGIHYHLSLKLKRKVRFVAVRNFISKTYKMNVNFSEFTTQYYDAFQYVVKTDSNYITSSYFTPLSNSPPSTFMATKKKREEADRKFKESACVSKPPQPMKGKKKAPKISNEELYNLVIKIKIKDITQLSNLANIQMQNGKSDLHCYIMSHTRKQTRQDMLDTAWSIYNAPKQMQERGKTRMEKVEEALAGSCVASCEGDRKWLKLALETLCNNKLTISTFTSIMREALIKGRGKKRNIMIYGESNCAKSFLFRPLKLVFKAFINPGDTKFAWIGIIDVDVIFLNDIRYDEEKTMAWDKFLNLLEGEIVHINMPKTHYTEDYEFKALTPVFATSNAPIVRIANKHVLQSDTNMMMKRWTTFHFTHEIADEDIIETDPCGRCFCELITGY